ncbi:type 2 DNA topoisomerase 6 subunit B-like [Chiloscyllium punctatum]|uniref:type 2 DNA topoisomerase 6 subunit B-like n=1 Tax=Chiloscyllium punctatum TaxID=137246 RepID=UPI003B64292F
MLLLFLFIQYWDDFHFELLDVIAGQKTIVEHLDQILHYNKDVVRKSVQPVLHQVLDECLHYRKDQRKMQTATTVICDAIHSVLSSSTNRDFRIKSLQLLKVSNTQEIKTSLQNTLQNIIQNRFLLSRVCDMKRIHSGDGDRVLSSTDSAAPETSQDSLYDADKSQKIHTELDGSESDLSFTLSGLDSALWGVESPKVTVETDSGSNSIEQGIGAKKRQLDACGMKTYPDFHSSPFKNTVEKEYKYPRMENLNTSHVSLLKTDMQVSASFPIRLTSETIGSFGVQCSTMSTEETISGKTTDNKEEYLWLQEVSNLSDWTQ